MNGQTADTAKATFVTAAQQSGTKIITIDIAISVFSSLGVDPLEAGQELHNSGFWTPIVGGFELS